MDSNKKEPATLRIPALLKEAISTEAQNLGYSFNEYVLLLINQARQCRR